MCMVLGLSLSFQSCKDYDDDIESLNNRVDSIATSLSDLASKVNGLVQSVTYNKETGVLTVTPVSGSAVTYQIGQDVPEYELKVDGTSCWLVKDGVQVGDKLEITLPEIPEIPEYEEFDPDLLTVNVVNGEYVVLYNDKETKVKFPEINVKHSIVKNGDTITISIDDETVSFKLAEGILTSLVYQPSLYVNGIEATEYPWMPYTTLTATETEDVTFTDKENTTCVVITSPDQWNYTQNGKKKTYNPIVWVNYHVNPINAQVIKENLSIISGDAEVITTRASVAGPQLDENTDIILKEGVLSIPLVAIGEKIPTEPKNENETVELKTEAAIFALQANVKTAEGEDRVVTSDYAALYSTNVIPKAIAYNVKDYNGFDIDAKDCEIVENPDELWPSVKDAIVENPTLRVAYNGQINLKDVLAIHYSHLTLTKQEGTHKIWKWGEEAAYGLKYDFALIHYTAGKNVTSDSKYVDPELIKEGVVAPRIVDEKGEPTSESGISAVGRHPLVQVRILDANNDVVLHAYIKLEIVQTVNNYEIPFDKGSVKFDCNGSETTLTWAEVSNKVFETVGYSKEEFEALYQVEVADGSDLLPYYDGLYTKNELYQYVKANNKFSRVTNSTAKYGIVTEIGEEQGTTNPVLTWKLTMNDQQRIYDLENHSVTIYVRYVRNTSNPDGTASIAPVYYAITVSVEKPQGNVTKKIQEYWYNNSTNTRLNVAYPKDGGNTKTFTVDLNQVWEANEGVNRPVFNMGTTFASFTDEILANQTTATKKGGYKYYFTAANNNITLEDELFGRTYKLFAGSSTAQTAVSKAIDIFGKEYDATTANALAHALKSDEGVYMNNTLYAYDVNDAKTIALIATIDQNTGKISYNNNSIIAKCLLNAFDHSEAKLYAEIGICAFSPCDIVLSLKDAEYPAYFLRPISIEDNKTGEFLDAQSNASVVNIAEIFDFEDWRDVKFKDGDNYENVWLYAFYGLQGVEVKTELITTDLNGNDLEEKLLSEVSKNILITQPTAKTFTLSSNAASYGTEKTWNSLVEKIGQIKYENNGNNVGSFNVRILVDFRYDWGTIRAYVVCHVKSTMGN